MEYKVGIIGLGYVGLPLAVECAKHFRCIGFDINENRIQELQAGKDSTLEMSVEEMSEVESAITYTSDQLLLSDCNLYIITVPTPVDETNSPNLTPIRKASDLVSKYLAKGDIVVYESTVFPGCTEEICVPILEAGSGLVFNKDFFCGYSPERINPGDKEHRVANILKVTSGSTAEVATVIDEFYNTFIRAGTFKASTIKVAEAAKVIENSQRDINIAFVNELALIFEKLEIDTAEVLEAAGTKWNFLPFKPGLVGGHCIGVDPFYLTQKAEEVGYNPQVILSGRRINDGMGAHIAQRVIKLLAEKNRLSNDASVLILGFTFKENCPDTRNTKVIDIYKELLSYHVNVKILDPIADTKQATFEYNVDFEEGLTASYDAIILAVAHEEFLRYDWNTLRAETPVIYDVKSVLAKQLVDGRL